MITQELAICTRKPADQFALPFVQLVAIYMDLGLDRFQASAAAQADFLESDLLAFRRRGEYAEEFLLYGDDRCAA